ncbi:MAG: CapA family protein [Clostridiaceae bacterium]|nr:CapA family protein [Clostridiaceae bacterium]
MRKQKWMAVLLVAAFVLLLTGCGQSGVPTAGAVDTQYSGVNGQTSIRQAATDVGVDAQSKPGGKATASAKPSVMEITPEMAKAFENGDLDVEAVPLPPAVITISAVGDIMAHDDTFQAAKVGNTYDFTYMMAEIQSYGKGSDFLIGNLETTLAGASRGYTGYPDFNTPEQIADALVDTLGMDLVSTANNHSLDRGFTGLCTTLDTLDEVGLYHVGTNRSEVESETPLVVTIGGVKFGFINYTYGLNNPKGMKYKYSVNIIDKEKIRAMTEKATEAGAEYVIALMHWGVEYSRTPSTAQKELAEWIFANTDVRLIIGTHPHVVQPIDEITVERNGETKTGVVLYSLGNFTGSQMKAYTNTGMLATITLKLSPENENTSAVESIDCTMLYIDPNAGQEKQYRVISMGKAIHDYDSGTDPLVSAKDYAKIRDYMEDYREQLEVLPFVRVQ